MRFFMLQLVVMVCAALLGSLALGRTPVLTHVGVATDMEIIDQVESPYQGILWSRSEHLGIEQMVFNERFVQGTILKRPSWEDVVRAGQDGSFRAPDAAAPTPRGPGPVAQSPYFSLLHTAPMIVARGDRQRPLRVLMLGLGTGVGITSLAHHFPEATFVGVDVDPLVVSMALEHYPLLAHLRTLQNGEGVPRLTLDASTSVDARQYVRRARRAGNRYDVVILDVYSGGGTIPAHLATLEFFTEVQDVLADGGVLACNIIGSLSGDRSRRLGGVVASLHASGFAQGLVVPVMVPPALANITPTTAVNYLLLFQHGGYPDLTYASDLDLYAGLAPLDPGREHGVFLSNGGDFRSQVFPLGKRGEPDDLRPLILPNSRSVSLFDYSLVTLQGGRPQLSAVLDAALDRYGPRLLAGYTREQIAGVALVKEQVIPMMGAVYKKNLADAIRRTNDGHFVYSSRLLVGDYGPEAQLRIMPPFRDARMNADIVGR